MEDQGGGGVHLKRAVAEKGRLVSSIVAVCHDVRHQVNCKFCGVRQRMEDFWRSGRW